MYTVEKISSNQVKLTFTVEAEAFEQAVQAAYLKNRKSIAVPGFRKGKAPRSVIERMYGSAIFYDDAIEAVANEEYPKALDAEKLEVVDQPQMTDVQPIEAGKPVVFEVTVYVKPEVTLGQYKGLTVEVAKNTLKDEDVDARIERDRKSLERKIEVDDRPVAEGDTVNLNYAGTVDGVAFEGGTAENQTLVIGSNSFIPGFEAQMVGMNIGEEKDLDVTFPEEYHAAELAGKAAVFHVKANSIEKTELPELDDEFAADKGFDTFADYKQSVVEELTKQIERRNEAAVEDALVEKATENASMDIPASMIDEEANYIVREMEMNMYYQGLRMADFLKYTGQTIEQLKAGYKGEAEKRVKTNLTIEAIRKAEGIEPTEEDIEKATAEQAEAMGQELEAFKSSLTDEQKKYLADSAAVKLVLALLKADATVTEKAEEAPADAE